MTIERHSSSVRRGLLAACGVVALAALVAAVGFAQGSGGDDVEVAAFAREASAPAAKAVVPNAVGPDVVVFSFDDGVFAWGQSGGFVGYSIGTTSCNRGDTPLNWCDQEPADAPPAREATTTR